MTDINDELLKLIREDVLSDKAVSDNLKDVINILVILQQAHEESANDHSDIINSVGEVLKAVNDAVKDPKKLSEIIDIFHRMLFHQDFMGVEMLRDIKRYGMVDRMIRFIWFSGIMMSIATVACVVITVLTFMGR